MQSSTSQQTVAEFTEFTQLIGTLPEDVKPAFEVAFSKLKRNFERRAKTLRFIQEALGQLRLDAKYLVFDLEATRRERDRCRQLLEERNDGR